MFLLIISVASVATIVQSATPNTITPGGKPDRDECTKLLYYHGFARYKNKKSTET